MPVTAWARQACSECGQEKAITAFGRSGDAGEDLTRCRACRGAAKRPASRARVAAQAGQSYHQVAAAAKPGRLHALHALPTGLPDLATASGGPATVEQWPAVSAAHEPAHEPAKAFPVPASMPPAERPYPALRAVLRYLPARAAWTETERAHWLAAVAATVDLEIAVTAEGTPEGTLGGQP